MDNNKKVSELTVGELKELIKEVSEPIKSLDAKFTIKGTDLLTVINRANGGGSDRQAWAD